ncbi:MAG: twin-arginine translocation signal domain-containing protein, partial [Pseudomonadota bacterium]
MAKSTKSRKPSGARSKKQAAAPSAPSRRSFLKLVRNGALAAGGLGAVGFFTFRSVQAMQFERDLTRIGQGKPAVVQVHDPQCPT